MMKPNPINKTVSCDIPNRNHRCSPLIKYSSVTNKAFDTSVGLATKESTRIKGLVCQTNKSNKSNNKEHKNKMYD